MPSRPVMVSAANRAFTMASSVASTVASYRATSMPASTISGPAPAASRWSVSRSGGSANDLARSSGDRSGLPDEPRSGAPELLQLALVNIPDPPAVPRPPAAPSRPAAQVHCGQGLANAENIRQARSDQSSPTPASGTHGTRPLRARTGAPAPALVGSSGASVAHDRDDQPHPPRAVAARQRDHALVDGIRPTGNP